MTSMRRSVYDGRSEMQFDADRTDLVLLLFFVFVISNVVAFSLSGIHFPGFVAAVFSLLMLADLVIRVSRP